MKGGSFGSVSRKVLVVLLLFLFISGCAVRFVYNQLDWLVPWYLEDYMELEGEQSELFEQRLHEYLLWHRENQLPQYASFLNQVADKAESGLSNQDIDFIQTQTEQFADALVLRLLPDMMDLFATASDDQLNGLFEKFDEDNEGFREDYIEATVDAQRKLRQKEVVRYVQRWTGRLNHKQLEIIEAWSENYELMGVDLEQSRLAWQKEFKRVLELRADASVYQSEFKKLLSNSGFGRSDELQSKFDHNAELLVDLYKQIDRSLADKQRKKMVAKLRSYANDFLVLSGQK